MNSLKPGMESAGGQTLLYSGSSVAPVSKDSWMKLANAQVDTELSHEEV